MIKKRDIIILLAVVSVSVIGITALSLFGKTGTAVVITQNGTVTHRLSLYKNQTVELGSNTVVIKDATVYVEKADCENQICVNTGKISEAGQQIICLPNKVLIEVTAYED